MHLINHHLTGYVCVHLCACVYACEDAPDQPPCGARVRWDIEDGALAGSAGWSKCGPQTRRQRTPPAETTRLSAEYGRGAGQLRPKNMTKQRGAGRG
jgi:hypothetical protein